MATGQSPSPSQEVLKTSLLPKGSSVHSHIKNIFDSDMEDSAWHRNSHFQRSLNGWGCQLTMEVEQCASVCPSLLPGCEFTLSSFLTMENKLRTEAEINPWFPELLLPRDFYHNRKRNQDNFSSIRVSAQSGLWR